MRRGQISAPDGWPGFAQVSATLIENAAVAAIAASPAREGGRGLLGVVGRTDSAHRGADGEADL